MGFRSKAQGCECRATLGPARQCKPTPTGLRPSLAGCLTVLCFAGGPDFFGLATRLLPAFLASLRRCLATFFACLRALRAALYWILTRRASLRAALTRSTASVSRAIRGRVTARAL